MKVGILLPAFFELQTAALAPAILSAVARACGHEVTVVNLNRRIFERLTADFPGFDRVYWDERYLAHPGQAIFSHLLFGSDRDTVIDDLIQREHGKPIQAIAREYEQEIESAAIKLADCAVVGVTINPFTLLCGVLLARRLRKQNPTVFIVAGGNLCADQGLASQLLDCFSEFDAAVVGEGEETWAGLLNSFDKLCQPQIPGLMLSSDKDAFSPRPLMSERKLDQLIPPDFSWLSTKEMFSSVLPVLSARGCRWGQCRFCSDRFIWPGYRARSPQAVVEEMVVIAKEYSNHRFMFLDLAFNVPYDRALEMCDLLSKAGVDFDLWAQLRARPFTPELAIAMKKAGFSKVQFGLEALATNVLKQMNKGMTCIDNIEAMKIALSSGLSVTTNLIKNHPGERDRDLLQTLEVVSQHEHLFNRSTILGLYEYVVRHKTTDNSSWLAPTFPLEYFPPSYHERLPVLEWSYDHDQTATNKALWSRIKKLTAKPAPTIPLSYVDFGDHIVIYGHERGPIVLREELKDLITTMTSVDESDVAGFELIEQLQELRLIYRENGRLISTVLPLRELG